MEETVVVALLALVLAEATLTTVALVEAVLALVLFNLPGAEKFV